MGSLSRRCTASSQGDKTDGSPANREILSCRGCKMGRDRDALRWLRRASCPRWDVRWTALKGGQADWAGAGKRSQC